MALSLGVKKGASIRIGDSMLNVKAIIAQDNVVVTVDGKEFFLSEEESVEVLPEVFIFCGKMNHPQESYARLAIKAPRSISIERVHK